MSTEEKETIIIEDNANDADDDVREIYLDEPKTKKQRLSVTEEPEEKNDNKSQEDTKSDEEAEEDEGDGKKEDNGLEKEEKVYYFLEKDNWLESYGGYGNDRGNGGYGNDRNIFVNINRMMKHNSYITSKIMKDRHCLLNYILKYP